MYVEWLKSKQLTNTLKEIKAVMGEYKISSADIAIRCDATIDDLIDVLEAKSRSYIPVIYALNKIDAISIEELDLIYRIPNACPISSEHGWNIDELLEQMWEKLELRRIYTKPKGKSPDYDTPVVLKRNACTVEDFVSISAIIGENLLIEMVTKCNAIHKTIVEQFKHAIVYGQSVKHQPQRVGLAHELADEDISESPLQAAPMAVHTEMLIFTSHHHKEIGTAPFAARLWCFGLIDRGT